MYLVYPSTVYFFNIVQLSYVYEISVLGSCMKRQLG